ncbi:MAG: hypothetical protein OHK0013_44080 [Sandaracinaceae bacterium]
MIELLSPFRSPDVDPFGPLEAITSEGCNIAHAKRPVALDDELAPWLSTHDGEGWEWSGDPSSLPGPTLASFVAPLPPRTRAVAAQDVADLATRVARWTKRKHVRARFDVVRGDSCRKFHADYVAIRVLVTYVGPGTEWVEDADADRSFLGRHDLDVQTCNERIVRDPGAIRRADAGDVVVLKGAAYPRNELKGAIHRSPPIEHLGHRVERLVLRIDVASCAC